MKKIALISSMPKENDFLLFHYKLKEIAQKKHEMQIDLLRNGEFCLFLTEKGVTLYYGKKQFFPQKYDLAFMRMAIKASHGADYYIARAFHQKNIPVINPAHALYENHDKLHILQKLAAQGIPVTPTVVIRNRDEIEYALERINTTEYIIKSCFGSGGRGILHANSITQIYGIFDYMWYHDRNQILLIQPYIKTKPVSDIRTIFLNYKPWRSMMRLAAKDEFRSNVKLGGRSEITTLTPHEEKICLKAAKISQLPMAGIDFLRTDNGPIIMEINGCPGFTGISSAYMKKGICLEDELVLFLKNYVALKNSQYTF